MLSRGTWPMQSGRADLFQLPAELWDVGKESLQERAADGWGGNAHETEL